MSSSWTAGRGGESATALRVRRCQRPAVALYCGARAGLRLTQPGPRRRHGAAVPRRSVRTHCRARRRHARIPARGVTCWHRLLDRELRYVRINDARAAVNGRPAAGHVGRTIMEMIRCVADRRPSVRCRRQCQADRRWSQPRCPADRWLRPLR